MKLIMKLASIKVLSALILSILLSVFAPPVNAEIPTEIKKLQATAYVNNFSSKFPNFLAKNEALDLNKKLKNFASSGKGEIAIAIVDDFYGMDANQFSTELFNYWKIGNKGKDNGILVTIKPTETPPGRSIYISTGYGAESLVTDFKAKQIIENQIKPNFIKGNFFKGLDIATDSIIELMNGGKLDKFHKSGSKGSFSGVLPVILVFLIFIRMLSNIGKQKRRDELSANSLFLGSTMHHHGGFGGGSFGGDFFGGFGGGFGGGGGSGGSW